MAVPKIAQNESPTPTTPESRLLEAERVLRDLETEHQAARDKIAALSNSTSLSGASTAEIERLAPGTYERASEFFGLTAHQFAHAIDAAIIAEPEVRARLAAQHSLVSRLRQQVRGRQASAMRGEYLEVARRTAKALDELNKCIIAERDIADRVQRTGVMVSPLPDLGFNLVGTRDTHNSPMAGWFRRAKSAGVL